MARPIPGAIRVGFWALIATAGIHLTAVTVRQAQFNWPAYLAKSVHAFQRNGHVLYVTPALAIGTVITGVALEVVGTGMIVLLAFLAKRGANWARIVLSAWCGSWIVAPVGGDILEYIATALMVAAIVCLWLPRAIEFMRLVKADRKRYKSQQLI